jgi:uncharacterized membrane protein YccC
MEQPIGRRWLHADPQDLIHAVRTAVATVASMLLGRLFHLPEPYWAAIATAIAMQSTLGAAWRVSRDRFIGSAMGAAAGGLLSTYAGANIGAFGAGVVALGLICPALRVARPAYHYAVITLIIVMMTAHAQRPWIVALHRFVEISVGLVVGLIVTATWPEPETARA